MRDGRGWKVLASPPLIPDLFSSRSGIFAFREANSRTGPEFAPRAHSPAVSRPRGNGAESRVGPAGTVGAPPGVDRAGPSGERPRQSARRWSQRRCPRRSSGQMSPAVPWQRVCTFVGCCTSRPTDLVSGSNPARGPRCLLPLQTGRPVLGETPVTDLLSGFILGWNPVVEGVASTRSLLQTRRPHRWRTKQQRCHPAGPPT